MGVQQLFPKTIGSFYVIFAMGTAEQTVVVQIYLIVEISRKAWVIDLYIFLFSPDRPGRVCIPGPVSGRDVHENVWPWTPELFPLLIQLF